MSAITDEYENPAFDHEFEAEIVCTYCLNQEEWCGCDDDDRNIQDSDDDVCVVCGEEEAHISHQEYIEEPED